METQITTVSLAFPPRKQYAIPSYQRNYVWTRQGQWEPLWEDVKALTAHVRAAESKAKPHFLGTIITKQIGTVGFIDRWSVAVVPEAQAPKNGRFIAAEAVPGVTPGRSHTDP